MVPPWVFLCQLVFGVNVRVSSELLQNDALATVGLGEVQADDFELDTPGLEFNNAFKIRQRARQLCMEASAKDKVRLSSAGPIHKQQTWNAGQWVLIGSGQGHVTRASRLVLVWSFNNLGTQSGYLSKVA